MALIPTLWGPQTGSLRPPVCIHSRSHDQSVVNNILKLALQIHHSLHNEYTFRKIWSHDPVLNNRHAGQKTHIAAENFKHKRGKAQVMPWLPTGNWLGDVPSSHRRRRTLDLPHTPHLRRSLLNENLDIGISRAQPWVQLCTRKTSRMKLIKCKYAYMVE